ncbi:putative minor capsid protein [Bacillus sonorensis]|uniref:putative minor capsid protein n=1 Tax=Bacillus sonorensis TaxID=119858 RepID=UPI00098A4CC0|nr:putative minor capsid protein [Bacillus sonorensis]
MAKPIPKELLIHSISYEEYAGKGRHGDTWKAPINIDFVRVEPIERVTRNGNGEEITSQTTVFIDAVYSKPIPKFVEKSKVTFNGRTRFVNEIKEQYAKSASIHHWELMLV